MKEYSSLQKANDLQKQCCPLLGDCSAFWANTSALPCTVCSLTWYILKSYPNLELSSHFFPLCLEKGCMNDICQLIRLLILLQRGFLKAAVINKARSEHYLTSMCRRPHEGHKARLQKFSFYLLCNKRTFTSQSS